MVVNRRAKERLSKLFWSVTRSIKQFSSKVLRGDVYGFDFINNCPHYLPYPTLLGVRGRWLIFLVAPLDIS